MRRVYEDHKTDTLVRRPPVIWYDDGIFTRQMLCGYRGYDTLSVRFQFLMSRALRATRSVRGNLYSIRDTPIHEALYTHGKV